MTASTDHRQYHRIFYRSLATLSSKGVIYPCEIIDLSLKGCLLNFEQPWQGSAEQSATLKLRLSDEISIIMEVMLTHVDGNTAGFRCQHIDINSISELRRLVELNLGSSELLERDLLALTSLSQE
jgi:hypothetical protein